MVPLLGRLCNPATKFSDVICASAEQHVKDSLEQVCGILRQISLQAEWRSLDFHCHDAQYFPAQRAIKSSQDTLEKLRLSNFSGEEFSSVVSLINRAVKCLQGAAVNGS